MLPKIMKQHHRAMSKLPGASIKGKAGRRGYPEKALNFAKSLRRKHPDMKARVIRRMCLEKFSQDEMPKAEGNFRRWLNRPRKNRAN
jgi:hypothetical protein